MLLFYIRHGDPIYDPDSLTPLGLRQAEAVAKRLSLYGLDEIYASSSNRAMTVVSSAAASGSRVFRSGKFNPRSHLLTALSVT